MRQLFSGIRQKVSSLATYVARQTDAYQPMGNTFSDDV